MFLLRRAATRAISQSSFQFSTVRQSPARLTYLQPSKPTLSRTFHYTRVWRADEQGKASPAESAGETVTTEPSAGEQKGIETESIATPDVADAAQHSTYSGSQDAVSEASGTTGEPVGHSETARSSPSSVTRQAQDFASSAAETAQSVASNVASAVQNPARTARAATGRDTAFPPRDSPVTPGGAEAPPSRILYVGNLFFEVTAQQLEEQFGQYGEITNSRVVSDMRGMSKGFGYVEFKNQEDAAKAIKNLDQSVFEGRRMAVQYHVRREPYKTNTQQNHPPSKTLFIGNMSYQMSDRDLNDLFREIRDVLDVRVAIDRRSGQPRGFAHADFIDTAAAQRAKEHLEKKVIYGRQLRIDFSVSSSQVKHEST